MRVEFESGPPGEFLREAIPLYREALASGELKSVSIYFKPRAGCAAGEEAAKSVYSLDTVPNVPLPHCPAPDQCECGHEIVSSIV